VVSHIRRLLFISLNCWELFIKTLSISVIPSRIHFTPFSTRFVWLWPLSLVALTTANCGKCLLAQFSRHKIRFVLGFSFNYACISFTFSRAALSHRSVGETSSVYLSLVVNLNNEYFGDVLDGFNFMGGIFIIP